MTDRFPATVFFLEGALGCLFSSWVFVAGLFFVSLESTF
ncbi:hypothetical protein MPNT_170019 [Candidatus Methylacidithermus pantelleriae]|uniref:Uncharacterized protein n=1 Tax=Candidatus Methylacidithermus pantelleriae TaxID=2744239 RepID=A0A8J2BHE4_9BACT|nr:hypothetical protein MPNT_170019 [Candidatus Methylacidithermus pantelleriae]